MSTTWPKLKLKLLLAAAAAAFLLGQCQAHAGESHEASQVNNVTLTPPGLIVAQQQQQDGDEERDQDQLTPHAAPSSQRKLSRGKRFVAFPQGSSASGAVCLTTGVIGNPNLLYLSLGINWGVAYDLPNVTWVLQNAHGWTTKKSAKAQIKRRHRRELYDRLETMIDRDLYFRIALLEHTDIYSHSYVDTLHGSSDRLPILGGVCLCQNQPSHLAYHAQCDQENFAPEVVVVRTLPPTPSASLE